MLAFHYTSLETAIKIISRENKNSSLHFTNIRYCNDQSELTYGVNLFRECCARQLDSCQDAVKREKLSVGMRSFPGIEEDVVPYYISCFSSKADDYSQWMLYGDRGFGACLQFDLIELESSISRGHVVNICTKPVVYCKAENEKNIQKLTTEYLETEVMMDFFEHIPMMKSDAFSSEQETRLVINATDKSDVNFCYRAANGRIVPYLVMPFDGKALKGIRLGPKAKYPVNKKTMENYLRQQHSSAICDYSTLDL